MSNSNPNQYGLALHTTSPQLGLSISNFNTDIRSQTWDLDRELSNYLHRYLDNFIQPQTWQDLSFIAVAQGPGSFTSTRIGVVTARTLGQQLDLCVFPISTLAAVAWSQRKSYNNHEFIPVQMPATQGKLYGAIYQKEGENSLKVYREDTLMTPEVWQHTLQDLGPSYTVIQTPINLGMTVTSILELAYQEWQKGKRPYWSEVLPFYGI